MKKLIAYIKHYNEPSEKVIRQLAQESSKNHFKNVFCPSIDEQIAYQRAFRIAYRHQYAKNRLSA